ncbi:ATP-grasp domain-containing protein [Yersinia ruckeri]|nr:ATP-grasp domain-containing protein [Yersinia ruckeri]MCW6596064.1 ATP-grasp domain-containing protein [Yersinia ruckeri]UZY16903.1 ATP-grasp domain-containing protein [Yersinia ruckeri]
MYVIDNQVRHIALCEGDKAAVPEQRVIGSAVQMVANSATLSRSYAIDFGVTDSGDTTLIEMNDGFAISSYGSICPEIYFNLLLSRWQELTSI